MSWLVLVLSGVLEAVWATAMGKSEGFSKLSSSIVFAVAQYLFLVCDAGVTDVQAEHKTVELRFGQRVSAMMLNRILRRQHDKRLG